LTSTPSNFELTVVSASGRGDLLATELQTRGFDVGLVDVSSSIGERVVADLEGPFPISRPTPLLPAHLEWLMTHAFEDVARGFCIWLRNRPLEFRGRLAEFNSKTTPAIAHFRDYFVNWIQSSVKRKDVMNKVSQLSFEDAWIIEFAHSFAGNVLKRPTECYLAGEPFPINQSIQNVLFSPNILETNQAELRANGVHYIKAEGISDLQISKGRVSEIELNVGCKQVLRSRYWVWCLSSEETNSMSRKVASTLFPKGIATAEWAWRRFQVHFAKNALEEIVPPYLVLMDDIHFPWAFDNLIILKRRKSGLYDLWVRLPSENSKKPELLAKFTEKLKNKLSDRFPHWPFEVEAPWDEGPPLYPVFDSETLAKFSSPTASNFVFEGAESLVRQDWAGRFQKQADSMLRLQAMQAQEIIKAKAIAKEVDSDPAVHAP
jgi:hypothetical protein